MSILGGPLPEVEEEELIKEEEQQSWNPVNVIQEAFADVTELGEVWDEGRQEFLTEKVAPFAQKVDDSLTNVTGQNWVGDRTRNVINFGADVLYPTSEDVAFGAAVAPFAAAEPTPFGEALVGLKYGSGVASRAYRKLTTQGLVNLSTRLDSWLTNPIWSKANRAVTTEGIELSPTHMMSKGVSRSGDDVPQLARMFFARSGLRDGVFDLETWRKAGSDRNVMELFQTRWDQVGYREFPGKQFTSTRKRLITPFLQEYDAYLKKFDIDPKTIELHHIFGVNLSAPLYDGLRYGSKEWTEMTDLLNKIGVFPGAPATKKGNFILALEEPHDLLHNQFFKNTIGVKGEKFFNAKRMKLIRSGPAGRNQVAKEYGEIVKQGETLIQRGMNQIQNVFGLTDIPPEKLADAFSESLADGTTNIFKDGYKIESVNKVIKDLVLDIQIEDIINPLKPQLDEKASKALMLALRSPDPMSSVKALRQTKYGKQLELVFNQIPENRLKRLTNIRRGKSIRLDEQSGMRPDD